MAALTHDGYIIGASPANANQVSYDNSTSGLESTQVQNAIDELHGGLTNKLDSSIYAQFGCKNLNVYPYYQTSKDDHGITFTVNDDGSVTASGTNDNTSPSYIALHTVSKIEGNSLTLPNGSYIISGTPSGSGNNYYSRVLCLKNSQYMSLATDYGSGATFVIDGDDYYTDKAEIEIRITIATGVALSEPITFYPMIRLASVKDDAWEPYVKSNKQINSSIENLSNIYAQFGNKNLNIYPYFETTKEMYGITFTDNGDGSITASGTNDGTSSSYISLHDKSVNESFSLVLPNGKYILNGCPSNNNLYYITIQILLNGETAVLGSDKGSGVEFTVSGDDHYTDKAEIQIRIVINKNVELTSPVTFYPMIRLSAVSDDTWESYARSNIQLTNDIIDLSRVYAQFGNKNLNSYPYYDTTVTRRGITFIDNGDGTVTVSGTNDGTGTSLFDCHTRNESEIYSLTLPNGNYIISGCPKNTNKYYFTAQALIGGVGVTLGLDHGDGALVKLRGDDYSPDSVNIQLRIGVNSDIALSEPITFYPMIRLATVEDAAWTPYVKSNKQLEVDKADKTDNALQTTDKTIVGAINELKNDINDVDIALNVPGESGKNLLPLTIDNVKKYTDYVVWSGNSVIIKGVTYTFDVDNNGLITKIHADGTATDGDAWLVLYKEDTNFGNCILTGCPSGGDEHNSYILAAFRRNPSYEWYNDRGSGVSIPSNVTIEQVYINVLNGYAIPSGGIDFYPMIRPASVSDPTFVHYIPSVDSRLQAVESGLTNVDVALNILDGTGKNILNNSKITQATTVFGVTLTPLYDENNNWCGFSYAGTLTNPNYGFEFTSFTLKAGSYILSAEMSITKSFVVIIYNSNMDTIDFVSNDKLSSTFTISENTVVRVFTYAYDYAGDYSGFIIRPMLRLATVTDPTFVPYIPSVESRIEAVENSLTNLVGKVVGAYGTTDGSQSLQITFTGNGLTRRTHYAVYICGQVQPVAPVHVALNGQGWGIPEQVTNISIDNDLSGSVTVNSNKLIINCTVGGGWGAVRVIDLICDFRESVTLSGELVNN